MISKKLLSEVLGYEVRCCHFRDFNLREIVSEDGSMNRFINIYELAHKCKEWAHGRTCEITSSNDINNGTGLAKVTYPSIANKHICAYTDWFREDTEVEAIFKACEWIFQELQE